MIIHFICRGNAYRSRLAEAYLNSKKLGDIISISSGVVEKDYRSINGPISWYAENILQYNGLVSFMSRDSKQTTKKRLDESDFVIFFRNEPHDFCKQSLGFNSNNYEIWDILDIDDHDLSSYKNMNLELKKIKISEKTFTEIKKRIDDFIKRKKFK